MILIMPCDGIDRPRSSSSFLTFPSGSIDEFVAPSGGPCLRERARILKCGHPRGPPTAATRTRTPWPSTCCTGYWPDLNQELRAWVSLMPSRTLNGRRITNAGFAHDECHRPVTNAAADRFSVAETAARDAPPTPSASALDGRTGPLVHAALNDAHLLRRP
jgi:hypothetical protein